MPSFCPNRSIAAVDCRATPAMSLYSFRAGRDPFRRRVTHLTVQCSDGIHDGGGLQPSEHGHGSGEAIEAWRDFLFDLLDRGNAGVERRTASRHIIILTICGSVGGYLW